MVDRDSKPLISVIVPVYNTEAYLERCINSILNQTYDNLEVICVDDGSTDRSGDILDKIARCNSKVEVIHTKNKGVSSARNVALSRAKGDYIGFVDSDDYIHKDMYTILLNLFLKNNVDFVSCGYYYDDGVNVKQALNQKIVPLKPINIIETLYYIYKRDEYKGVAGYLWTRLFKRELIKDSDGNLLIQFDEVLNVGQDIVFLAKICEKVKKTLYTDRPLYYYYQRKNSTAHDEIKQLTKMTWVYAYEEIIKRYADLHMPDDLLEIIIRMYVYRCGKMLEIAIKYNDFEKIAILKEKIKNNLYHYRRSNFEHPERIQWILSLLSEDTFS